VLWRVALGLMVVVREHEKSREYFTGDDDKKITATILWILAAVAGLAFLLEMGNVVSYLVNPEWYAIQFLIKAAGG
jgi:hypothetical protein